MSRSKGRIRQDLLSVINNTGTVKQCRMSEVTGFLTKNVKEICWDLKFLSEVTGCLCIVIILKLQELNYHAVNVYVL
jgi:hypothetical protein